MKVTFVHPDLGIGGAERLVVDAATAMRMNGHRVVIVTNSYSTSHCFEESKNFGMICFYLHLELCLCER